MRQNYNWFGTRYNYYHSEFGKTDKTGIKIEKPIDLSLLKNAPHIKAVILEFGGSFKRAKVDFSEFLSDILSVMRLEFLEIKSSGHPLQIPPQILNAPLKFLHFSSAEKVDLSFLNGLTQLESLSINIQKEVEISSDLLQSSPLKSLSIWSKSGSLSAMYKLPTLEEVILNVKDLVQLESFASERIKKLNVISPVLGQLSAQSNFPHLENLTIISNAALNIPSNYFSNSIQNIRIEGTEIKPEFPTVISNLEHLQVSCDRLPTLNAPLLKTLNILAIKNETLNEVLGEVPSLETLTIRAMDNFDGNVDPAKTPNLISYFLQNPTKDKPVLDLSLQEKLAIIEINNGQNVEVKLPLKPTLSKLNLRDVGNEVLDLEDMEKRIVDNYDPTQSFIERQLSTNAIAISNCANLKEIKLSQNVRSLQIFECSELEEVTFDGSPETLDSIAISGCEQLQKIPAEMLLAKESIRFVWKASGFEITQKDFSKIIKDLAAAYDAKTRLEIGKFIFENNKDFKESAMAAFSIKSRNVFTLLERSLPLLSKNEMDFSKLSPSDIEGKTITVVGKAHEKKTTIKEQVARVGLKYVAKATDADFIIVCYTAALDYDENRIYLSEFTFEEYCKKEHPRFLVASASTDHIKKLRQIMWSTDPKSENLALEMLKKGGLLEEVIGEAVTIAKTSADPSVKRKYKAFLKGKVSEDWLKIMSSNKRNTYWIPKTVLPDYMRAKYKREGVFLREFLHSNRVDLEERMEAVKTEIVSAVLDRPHYLQLPTLYKTELEFILNLPAVKGKLKRLIVTLLDEVPTNLADHITLKEVTITCPNCEKLPSQIYDLSRLSFLSFSSDALNYVDDDILKLVQLKRIVFSAKQPVSLPGAFMELPKLGQTVFNGGKVFR